MVLRESRAAGQVKRGAIDRRVPSASIPFPTRALGARARPPTTGSEEMEESDAVGGVAVQLIDGEGEFAAEGAERFMAAAGVAGCGLSYAVVSIMGPQSSGTHRLPFPLSALGDRSIGWLVRRSRARSAGRLVRARWPPVRRNVGDHAGTSGLGAR